MKQRNGVLTAYYAYTDALDDDKVFAKYYDAASPERREKVDRYRFRKDKNLSLAAETLLRYALTRAGIASDRLEYEYEEHGRPRLKGDENVHFSLTHSGRVAACIVADRPVGIDVETIKESDITLAERFFAPAEYGILAATEDKTARDELFTRLWTLKESYLKETGLGLSCPLNSFAVSLDSCKLPIRLEGDSDYAFFDTALAGEYRLAVCTRDENIREVVFEEVDVV